MANGFVRLEFNEQHPSIDTVEADFSGQGHYGSNLLATNGAIGTGIVLETVDSKGIFHRASEVHSSMLLIRRKILRQDAMELSACVLQAFATGNFFRVLAVSGRLRSRQTVENLHSPPGPPFVIPGL